MVNAVPVEIRYMRNALTESIEHPLSGTKIYGDYIGGSISLLEVSDDQYMVFASELVGVQQVVEWEFTGSHSGHLPFLQEAVELHGSIGVNLEITAFNYVTNAYETTGTMYYLGTAPTSDVTIYIYNILGNKKYRDTDGSWKVKVKAWTTGSPAPSFTLYIDYLHYRTVAFQLGIEQTTTAASNDLYVDDLTIGIRVWRVNADESETEISAGSVVATVTGPSETTTLSATWTPPPDNLNDVVGVIVGVYRDNGIMKTTEFTAGGLPLLFITEDLNSFLTPNVQWTVYYAFFWSKVAEETYYRFGSSTYNSRIENFTWGIVAVGRFTFHKKGTTMICITS